MYSDVDGQHEHCCPVYSLSYKDIKSTAVYFVTIYLWLYSVKVISTEIYMLECPLDKVEENEITFSRRVLAIPPTLPPLNPPRNGCNGFQAV